LLNLHGFLNINKPEGMTSYDVIRKIKPLLPRKTKIGHLGTLDPMASGVLPLALGNATRIIPFIKNENKTYVATMTLGAVSDTLDAWGQVSYTGQTSHQHYHYQ
jgi:tRNA pseudouridine55 synthase